MTDSFTFHDFAASPVDLKVEPAHLEALFRSLLIAENPRSVRVLFWLLLHVVQSDHELHEALAEEWLPSETDLAQLLEDVGGDGTRIVLSFEILRGRLERLWQLSEDAGVALLTKSSDPWEIASATPMAALYAERQLDELIAAVAQGQQWKDPAEILSPDDEQEFDLEVLLGLAQARMVKTKGSEALNIVTLRLLNHADLLTAVRIRNYLV